MGERAVGLILAGLDVDIDNGASWNRWYDLEHLAPNLALDGIVAGRRYVAPPDLHASRRCDLADPAWGSGRCVYLTWYATTDDPVDAIGAMSARRDELEAEGRMAGAGVRTVRTGDALDLVDAASDPSLRLDPKELVHVGHAGLRLIIDTEDGPARLGPGVVAALRFRSRFVADTWVELQLLDRPAIEALDPLRSDDPRSDAPLDAGFEPIMPLHYPFLDAIFGSDLPRTIQESP